MSGTGVHCWGLKSDAGDYSTIPDLSVLFIPSAPYNPIPPQLLIKHMHSIKYIITGFSHNGTVYTFKYQCPGDRSKRLRTITVKNGTNGLFTLWSKDIYTSSLSCGHHYLKELDNFAGAGHPIPPK